MRKITKGRLLMCIVITTIVFCIGCNDNNFDNIRPSSVIGFWKLVEIKNLNPSDADWTEVPTYLEFYQFTADGKFKKIRKEEWEAAGSYTPIIQKGDTVGLLATFEDKSFSYYGVKTIYLRRYKEGLLIEDHRSFDGNQFIYRKVDIIQ